jgi:hypothetical protein
MAMLSTRVFPSALTQRFASQGARAGCTIIALALVLATFWCNSTDAQQILRNGFEAPKPAWVKSGADVPFEELAHSITDQSAHDGQRSEYLKLDARQGNHIYYQYAVGRGPINDDLNASVWIKANRPGIQIVARAVLPKERDPSHLELPLTALLRGETYKTAGRFQRLELGRAVQLAKQQQALMQAQLGRAIDFTDAYIDAILLNVYAGPGPTEVWIDDLEVGPVFPGAPSQPAPTAELPVQKGAPGKLANLTRPSSRSAQLVEFNGNQLLVGGKPFFFRGIRFSGTWDEPYSSKTLRALRDAGFNTVWFDYTANPNLLKEAVDQGFWLVPTMRVLDQDTRLASANDVRHEMERFTENDAVIFWHLGGTMDFEQTGAVGRVAQFMKNVDPAHPVTADVWAGLQPYSRSLQLLGIHRWPLFTTLELSVYGEWLNQRRSLANPGVFLWTWVQTHMPDWYTYLLYDQSGTTPFKEPVGPQAEQIRLLTYTALGAGCRGLGFWSDRFLADSHFGRDRLLSLALLNQELDLLEPLLIASQDDRPEWIDTSVEHVKAAVIRTSKGVLVLPMWLGQGAQFVPGQAAATKLTMLVPQIPQSHRAWEVTPADVRGLHTDRVVGGTRVTLPEFGLTAILLFTSDFTSEASLIGRYQTQARSRRQLAAQWSYDMALYEIEKVVRLEKQLEKQGHTLPDAAQLIANAEARLKTTKQHWDNHMFSEAFHEAQRALRPVRILMRAQWDLAVKGLDTPVASPYAVSFFTLPKHWEFMDDVNKAIPTPNVLPGGDFEIIPERVQETWRPEDPTIDDVELLAQRVSEYKVPMYPKKKAWQPNPLLKPNTPPPPGALNPPHKFAANQPDLKAKDNMAAAKGAADKGAAAGPAKNAMVTELPQQGKQCLMLEIKPKNPLLPPKALERTLLALTSPVVHLQPGTLVQISGWIRIPEQITASADGALFYDSAGGEPLAIRLLDPTPWKKFTLYRRVPDSGTLHVTVAMTGIGRVFFDDIRIEPLIPAESTAAARPAPQ